jgi:SAM-dependent methyltransferase
MSFSQPTEPSAYLLSYRNRNQEEDKRLDSQHDVITHAILGGDLIHRSIPLPAIQNGIADIACGTGIWLEDVRKTYFSGNAPDQKRWPLFVGFDVNAHAFDLGFAPAVTLIEHDCTQEFPSEYTGKFDLVNMRGLAYAVPGKSFSRLVLNAIKLLRKHVSHILQLKILV